MAKGLYYYLKQAWKKPDVKTLRERMVEWRRAEVFTKLEKPLRLDRARSLGYKDKKGFLIIRVRVIRGGHWKERPNKGRKSRRLTARLTLKYPYREIAEQRVAKKFKNLEVLNSYLVGKDGQHYFYEVICVDPNVPEIKNDPTINWICKPVNRGRVFKGQTSAGKRSRGLRHHNPMNKNRPSQRSYSKR